jgi:hypothetical protein
MKKDFSNDTPSLIAVIGGLLISSGLIYLYIVYAIPFLQREYDASVLFYIGVLIVYVIVSFVLHPQVDYGNMGFLDGLIDDPTQDADDRNRGLSLLKKLLYPGKLIAWSIISAIKLFK